MPIYEYNCNNCSQHFEIMQSIKDKPLVVCPKCKKSTLIKMVSAAAFRLKGSGWYETDFKDSGKKKNLASNSDSKESTIGKEESSSDTSKKESKESSTESNKNLSKNSSKEMHKTIETQKTTSQKETGSSKSETKGSE